MNCWWRRCVLCLACALQERPPLLGAGRFTINLKAGKSLQKSLKLNLILPKGGLPPLKG